MGSILSGMPYTIDASLFLDRTTARSTNADIHRMLFDSKGTIPTLPPVLFKDLETTNKHGFLMTEMIAKVRDQNFVHLQCLDLFS